MAHVDAISLVKRLKQERVGFHVPAPKPAPSLPRDETSREHFDAARWEELMDAAQRVELHLTGQAVEHSGDDAGDARAALEAARVGTIPTVYYVNTAISPQAHDTLVGILDHPAVKPAWISLKGRRVQRWSGEAMPVGDLSRHFEDKYDISPPAAPPALPPWLLHIARQLVQLGIFPRDREPNHVLINEYLAGQGILPHTDGPAYYPVVATLSLGCDALMCFGKPKRESTCAADACVQQLVLRRSSLVVFTDDAYTRYLHTIPDTDADVVGSQGPCVNLAVSGAAVDDVLPRTRRISLTFRHIPSDTPIAP